VEFKGRKSNRRFVGHIGEVIQEENAKAEYKVACLQPCMYTRDERGFVFGFPESEESSWALGSQVVEKLQQPILCKRGQLKFPKQIKTSD
jgi:hypothetical protein